MIELPKWMQAAVAEPMNALPEVRWDRLSGEYPGDFTVYGWVDREDGRADFAVLLFHVEPDGARYSWRFNTSSAKWSEEFIRRLQILNEEEPSEDGHHPCQRVEDVFGDLVPGAIALTTEDPMAAGGDIAGPEEPHGRGSAVVSLGRAVMVDGVAVTAMHLERDGALGELAIGLLLEGDINHSDPREHARVLNVMGVEEAAGVICELQAVAHRFSPGLAAEMTRLLEKRWGELEAEGLTRPR